MNKKLLGVVIPYYKNSEESEVAFKKLMDKLINQIKDRDDVLLYVYEDGQCSQWITDILMKNEFMIADYDLNNYGVSYARNKGIDCLIDEVDYILFIDADDDISDNFIQSTYEYCADKTHEIIESTFLVNGVKAGYDSKKVRSGCAGSAIATRIIGNIRFDESLQIGEDTKFMNEVCDLSKYRKKHCDTIYNYQYGINPESLIQKYNRQEIMKERN